MIHESSAPAQRRCTMLSILAGVLAIGIFVVDAITPSDVLFAVLYVVVVLIAAPCWRRGRLLLVALGCIILAVLGHLLPDEGALSTVAIINLLLGLAAIVVSTYLVHVSQASDQAQRDRVELLDKAHDAIFVRDSNDTITYWNRGAEERYGWTSREAQGRMSHDLLQTKFPVPLAAIKNELLSSGQWEGELVHTARDGSKVVVLTRWSLQTDENGRPVGTLETNYDITRQERAYAELRVSEQKYRNIFQTVGISIWEEDFSAVKALIDTLKAQGVVDFRRHLAEHPDFVRKAIGLVKVIDVNDATIDLFGARNKQDLLSSLHQVFVAETEAAFTEELIALAEGRTRVVSETVVRSLKGERLDVLFTITFPIEATRMDSVLVTIFDITERKRSEEARNRAQAELAHVNRVSTLGQLAASIAHEVNQPIAGAVMNAEAALRWLQLRSANLGEVRQALDRIVADGKRAGEVIGRIRALVRKAPQQAAPFDLNETIREVIALSRNEVLRHGVVLKTQLAGDLPVVSGDSVQLQQVILNLALNAIEAMSATDEGPRELLIATETRDATGVLVAVRDSGPGLDLENKERLFEAFYTTKPHGMGMGLAICRSIVEAHGGRLWADANEPRGAAFQFSLPAEGQQRAAVRRPAR